MSMSLPLTELKTHHPRIAAAVLATESLRQRHIADKLHHAKQLMDELFPLSQGSHQDVASYLVYYQHLLACHKDGVLSGLRQPSQFVALGGQREQPQSLLLKHESGCHLALCFDVQGDIGANDAANLQDVCLENGHLPQQQRHWLSLLHDAPLLAAMEQNFTASNGRQYAFA
ncbi:malate synthase [Shewanella sp. C32]|uniref:Malate synthase n=1 Tax=Shewanella electrica TaxID=515560 RepID=A0ABT2FQG9_9GAMM|nr:malate synthase [Shewanella electrica]MCH1925962.1 malate synthase [Shewanella electrica]MCS4557431.1 malate synthase [Shewanella electrica]